MPSERGGDNSVLSCASCSNRLLSLVTQCQARGRSQAKRRLGLHSSPSSASVLSWLCAPSLRAWPFSIFLAFTSGFGGFYLPSKAAALCLESVGVSTSPSPTIDLLYTSLQRPGFHSSPNGRLFFFFLPIMSSS